MTLYPKNLKYFALSLLSLTILFDKGDAVFLGEMHRLTIYRPGTTEVLIDVTLKNIAQVARVGNEHLTSFGLELLSLSSWHNLSRNGQLPRTPYIRLVDLNRPVIEDRSPVITPSTITPSTITPSTITPSTITPSTITPVVQQDNKSAAALINYCVHFPTTLERPVKQPIQMIVQENWFESSPGVYEPVKWIESNGEIFLGGGQTFAQAKRDRGNLRKIMIAIDTRARLSYMPVKDSVTVSPPYPKKLDYSMSPLVPLTRDLPPKALAPLHIPDPLSKMSDQIIFYSKVYFPMVRVSVDCDDLAPDARAMFNGSVEVFTKYYLNLAQLKKPCCVRGLPYLYVAYLYATNWQSLLLYIINNGSSVWTIDADVLRDSYLDWASTKTDSFGQHHRHHLDKAFESSKEQDGRYIIYSIRR
jgi:hypothetical protein